MSHRTKTVNSETRIKVKYRRDGVVGIYCVFCGGEGIDPFDILSPLSICPVCDNKKVVELEEPIRKCAFCDGTGVYPHTRLTCTACMGKGAQTVKEPVVVCPKCDGSGASIHGSNLTCLVCHGSGVVPLCVCVSRD
jgi:hypothetical protein